jgi:hypothetical protein
MTVECHAEMTNLSQQIGQMLGGMIKKSRHLSYSLSIDLRLLWSADL